MPGGSAEPLDRAALPSGSASGGGPAALVEVAVTLPVPGLYHYRVPAWLAAKAAVGARVLVRFGPRKVTGVIVRDRAQKPPDGVKAIDLSDVIAGEAPAEPLTVIQNWTEGLKK